ncbi:MULTISPECIES: flavin reductase family protein [Lacticaseibacillus]|uniref:Flavin reductase like domain-containing protein n=1 Tax=Lacticaseibacillus casei DSM 20011 = JCM 1134 = ATCC 393 TaxID=1423732 RepID=A0AAD1ESC4_LACCA|nr:flavin reductase family protein [Lacticaseibacillus casei]HAJ55322.1 flavin reductase family protein [Lactobacillus sp.]MBI6596523.1 flavin reductase family protein [Lacticaseibacillus casei]MBO1480214.1 flavin reductase family protein [Lacticaseibacillus casei]MBO2415553.1 flavin reductase family protein [Lacticaseibacillus casei]MCK2079852.1 flavin reductase family protein [Lacticaseibacillus casei]
MINLSANKLSPREQYKLLSGSIIPRPIAWITTQSTAGVINLAPFSFTTGISNQLPLLSVSILRDGQQPKDTAANLLARHEAVVHMVSIDLTKAMNQTAARLTPDQSELNLIDLPLVASTEIQVPGLQAARIRFETQLYQYVPIRDRAGVIITDLFILEIRQFHFADTVLDLPSLHVNPAALAPVARLAGPTYAELGQTFTLRRPK